MPRKLRHGKELAHRITPAAIQAWCEGNYSALHRALNLPPWCPSPLPLRIEALGVDPSWCPLWENPCCEYRELALALQSELRAAAGRDPVEPEDEWCPGN